MFARAFLLFLFIIEMGVLLIMMPLDPSGGGATSMTIEAGFFLLDPIGKSAATLYQF
jgi:hypothetical protein